MVGLLVLLLGVLWCGVYPASEAQARGKRAVPDLRRDAERRVQPQGRAILRLPVTLHMATDEGEPVARRNRVARWIRRTNLELQPFGLEIEVRSVRYLPAGWQSVTRWGQRRKLAHYAGRNGTIHVFVIEQLDRRKNPIFRRKIRGLHWRYRGLNPDLRRREYVVVTRNAPTTTLAHEVGHLFGLRHSTNPRNIMCSCRSGDNLGFSRRQGSEMRQGAAEYITRQGYRVRAYAHRNRR